MLEVLTKDSLAQEGKRNGFKYKRRCGGGDQTQVTHVRAIRVQTDRCRQGKAETTVGMNRLIQTCKYCFKGLS